MKGFLWGLIIVIVLAVAGYAGWYYFLKKSPEGGTCRNESRCEQGLKCVNKICSSGKIGSGCVTYKDCESGLLCTKSICVQKPDYSKYFDKVTISKIKPGSGPGPNNPPTITATFTRSDAFEIDFGGVKSTTVGPYYFEFVNATTGEVVRSTQGTMDTKFEGRDTGSGTDLSDLTPGQYDVNVYFNNEIIYSSTFTVTQ